MTTKRNVIAVSLAAVLLVSVAAPALAGTSGSEGLSVGVEQSDGVTITVTENGTAVENASVTVTALNNSSYAGEGTATTDANGTVSLPAPAENVTVEVVAEHGNLSATTTATLTASESDGEEDGPFGQRVSAYVDDVLNDSSVDHPGQAISEWVTENNPGADKKSDHAKEGGDRGPPEHAKKGDDKKDDKNGKDEKDDEDENDGKDRGKKKGHGK